MSQENDETAEEAAARAVVAPQTALQRESDRPIRPGFRNPPNARSKAQKAGKKKKR